MQRVVKLVGIAIVVASLFVGERAEAQPVDDGFRLTLETNLYAWVRQDLDDPFLGNQRVKEHAVGLAATNLGLQAGFVLGGAFFGGARVRLEHYRVEDGGKRLSWSVEPLLEGMIDTSGQVRPFAQVAAVIGGLRLNDSGGGETKLPSYGFASALGIHAFAGDNLSFDPAFFVRWTRGEVDGTNAELTDLTIGISIGISGWFGSGQR